VRETAFLLSSLFVRHLDLERLRALAAAPLDWGRMAAAAGPAAVAPLLWNAVVAAGLEARVPPALRERLREEAEAGAMQGAMSLATLARIAGALEAAGVEALALKGAALVLLAPDYLPLRHMSDLDLLVRPAQLERAARVLRDLGGVVYAELRDLEGRLLVGEELQALGFDSPASFTLDGGLVELHQDLVGLPGDPPADVDGLFARSRRVACHGTTVRIPDPVDQAGVLCHHVLRHHRSEPRYGPRHVADLEVLQALGVDLEVAARRHDTARIAPVRQSVSLIEATRRAALRPSRLWPNRCERALSPGWRRASLRARPTVNRLRALRAFGLGILFPPRRFLEARFGEQTRGVSLPLLWVRRVARSGWRFLSGR
jgi:hypothetical protein